ncbi:MAG: NrsF family protein [Xanthobacteraceae bacterium]
MKTDDLIDLLAHDATPQWPFRRLFDIALLCGIAVAGVLFFATIGPRHDFAQSLETVRFLLKFVVTLTLLTGAIGVTLALARPGVEAGVWAFVLAAAPLVLIGAVAAELYLLPPEAWMTYLVGRNAAFCLKVIPFLALGPLACLLLVLRRGAPANAGRAGALAGLTAGAIAATFYAAHCPDDSPLFIAVWYSLAIMAVTAVGYVGGRLLLRW